MMALQFWRKRYLALGTFVWATSCATPHPAHIGGTPVVTPPSARGLASLEYTGNQNSSALPQAEILLREAVKPNGPGCSIGASRMGQPIFAAAYGLANLETATPNTPETIFYASSMAKQFTALAVMLLVRDGQISLDDDARKYIPELPDFGRTITLRHLLAHTSGLRDIIDPIAVGIAFRVYDLATTWHDVLYYVSRQRALNFPPGTEYSYNNTGYKLSALAVERVSGRPFSEFVKDRIFDPLAMSKSSVISDYTAVVRGSATGYDVGDDSWHEGIPRSNAPGSSGLMTTVGDMLKWHEEVRQPRLFGHELAIMTEPVTLNSGSRIPEGLGLHLEPFRGSPFVYHGGGTSGHESFSGVLTERGDALVLLCNQFPVDADYIGREALGELAGIPDEPVTAVNWSPSTEQRRARVGTYASRATGEVFYIRLQDGELAFGQSAGPKLLSLARDYYRVGSIRRVSFLTGRDGSVNRILVRIGASRAPVIAERLTLPPAGPTRLEDFAGRYYSAESDVTYDVRPSTDGDLEFVLERWRSFKVAPLSGDLFKGYFMADFARDRARKIIGVYLSTDRSRRIWLRRIQ